MVYAILLKVWLSQIRPVRILTSFVRSSIAYRYKGYYLKGDREITGYFSGAFVE